MKLIIQFAGLLLAGLLFSLAGFTQEMRGTVKDSTGSVVPYASVNLRNKSGETIVAYTTTDARGVYVLHLPAGMSPGDCYLEARCVGYQTQNKALTGLPAPIVCH